MLRARQISTTLLAVCCLLAVATPGAGASIYTRVLAAYQSKGHIPPCQFTSQQLESALKGIDTYGAQYFADFTTAVQNALQSRAAGACSRSAAAAPSARRVLGPPLHLGSVTAATGSDVPAPIVMMAGLLALLGAGALLGALVWWRGWSPSWVASWRHMWSEAGFRAQGTWAEFSDWLRSD